MIMTIVLVSFWLWDLSFVSIDLAPNMIICDSLLWETLFWCNWFLLKMSIYFCESGYWWFLLSRSSRNLLLLIITVSFTGKNSAKVFSALSWNWSSKSLQVTKEAVELSGSSEPCRVGAHCITLKKLYAAEQKLYKEMKVRSSLDDRA